MSKEKVLTKKDLRKAAWRWLIGISTFNYETQLAPSTLFSVYPCLRKMYPDDEDLKKSCLNYMRYYNTMPWISPFVIGAALGIEDEGGISSLDAVNDFKVGLMGPLAGIGDTIGWAMIPTIFGSIAASMGMEGNPLGIFLWAAFTFVFLVVRILQYECQCYYQVRKTDNGLYRGLFRSRSDRGRLSGCDRRKAQHRFAV